MSFACLNTSVARPSPPVLMPARGYQVNNILFEIFHALQSIGSFLSLPFFLLCA
jgi:hypothetical protein